MSLFSKYPYINFSDYNLDWVIETVNELLPRLESLEQWRNDHKAEYEQLLYMVRQIYNGNLTPALRDALTDWLEKNIVDIVADAITTNVYFGLTDSGYFVAYIPESWKDITFRTTGYDITVDLVPEYGHLVLLY